ncbi:hypothetical protein C9374_010101 [Naegleria lovaniensis]|uniref:Uncharacterized protein n=1 Tax=Naegleria lovaniensis TaxID=51637 RepID=A0AA88KJP6_NAELO|nr:uncharacterized protein C9374_010101 [Naegleria lovaniensis]KAG2375097.1 hypothetical protein C9374_010101 [Naegleria lovaniensis]
MSQQHHTSSSSNSANNSSKASTGLQLFQYLMSEEEMAEARAFYELLLIADEEFSLDNKKAQPSKFDHQAGANTSNPFSAFSFPPSKRQDHTPSPSAVNDQQAGASSSTTISINVTSSQNTDLASSPNNNPSSAGRTAETPLQNIKTRRKSMSDQQQLTNRRMTSRDLRGLFQRIGYRITNEQIREIIQSAHESYYRKKDIHLPNDSISFNEFVHLIMDKPEPSGVGRNQLLEAFKILSENDEEGKDGWINTDELEHYLTHFHYWTEKSYVKQTGDVSSLSFLTGESKSFTKREFNKVMDILDPYRSGRFNFIKFIAMIYDGILHEDDSNFSHFEHLP